MASITIRNIDETLKERLRIRAAQHGHSMEEEARIILRRAINGITGPELLNVSTALFGKEYGVELELPSRADERETPRFSGS
jgi:plasmid stability protein